MVGIHKVLLTTVSSLCNLWLFSGQVCLIMLLFDSFFLRQSFSSRCCWKILIDVIYFLSRHLVRTSTLTS